VVRSTGVPRCYAAVLRTVSSLASTSTLESRDLTPEQPLLAGPHLPRYEDVIYRAWPRPARPPSAPRCSPVRPKPLSETQPGLAKPKTATLRVDSAYYGSTESYAQASHATTPPPVPRLKPHSHFYRAPAGFQLFNSPSAMPSRLSHLHGAMAVPWGCEVWQEAEHQQGGALGDMAPVGPTEPRCSSVPRCPMPYQSGMSPGGLPQPQERSGRQQGTGLPFPGSNW